MADAQAIEAPLKKGVVLKDEVTWIEVGEEYGFTPSEKVKKGSNEHIFLTQDFESEKKYMFELANDSIPLENPSYFIADAGRSVRQLAQKKFPPSRNIILSSQIIWNNQRRNIRYYDGCTSIFVDKQPSDKDLIKSLIDQTAKQRFLDGKKGVFGYERMLAIYLNICSWNVESPFRTKSANGIFKPINADKIADETTNRIELIEKALKLSKEATDKKVLIHSRFLGLAEKDWDSDNDLTSAQIRANYREYASLNPASFIESFGNKAIELKYYIEKALETGDISTRYTPNKTTWKGSNTVICDISGLKSHDAIMQRIFEFSQSEEGADFVVQLMALNK